MFDNNFDPYQSLVNLDTNVQQLIRAHNLLAKRVEEQGHTIDLLIEGLTRSNKANEILMAEMSSTILDKLKETR